MENMNHSSEPNPVLRWIFWGFVGIAAFFLLTEHTAHVFGILPWLLILACPLMHVFGHHGHGGHQHDATDQSRPSDARPRDDAGGDDAVRGHHQH